LSKKSVFLTFLILFFFFSNISFAQNATVKGIVVSAQDKQPIAYASISVLSRKDSAVIAGTITKKNGAFILQSLDTGSYILYIAFMGYRSTFQNIAIPANTRLIQMDSIPIPIAGKWLNELVVTGNKVTVSNKADKQIYKSAQFETAKGGNAIDVLKNLPSVSVNASGDISVRGSSGFMVLVNGKPVITDAQTILSQLPANTIENIELITAPSAKYDADGKGGIVNIITKKGSSDGLSFTANLQGGLPPTTDYNNLEKPVRFGGDATLNFKQKKWDVSLGTNYQRNDVNGQRSGDVFTKNFNKNTITRFPSFGERSFDKYNYAGRLAIIFTANKNNVFNLGLFESKKYQARRADIVYHNSTSDLATQGIIHSLNYFNSNVQTKEGEFSLANVDYTHTFKNKSSLTAAAFYERANLHGNTINKNLTYPAKDLLMQQVNNPYQNPIDGYRFKLDHAIAIGKGKLESGYQYKFDSQLGQFEYLVNPATNQTDLARFNGSAKSTNSIHSLYSQYAAKANKWQYIAGLRYEYAKREVILSYDVQPHKLSLSNLFPSANLVYTFNPTWNIKAGYSKRVQRNNNFELNPIPEREHSETLEQGDPDLLPQFVDLAEIGINRKLKTGSFFATLYYQHIKNPIQRVNSVYADSILNRVFTNAKKARLYGLEMGSTLKASKRLNVYVGANVYNYKISGNLNILGISSSVNNADWVYSINANANWDAGKNWALQGAVNYTSSKPTAQGEDSRFLTPNFSIKKTFLNNKCSVGLLWQNINLGIFNANQQRITTFGKDFFTTTNYVYETDVLLLQCTYKLNKLNKTVKLPSSEIGEKEF
jgi:ferric enterobactin receptor